MSYEKLFFLFFITLASNNFYGSLLGRFALNRFNGFIKNTESENVVKQTFVSVFFFECNYYYVCFINDFVIKISKEKLCKSGNCYENFFRFLWWTLLAFVNCTEFRNEMLFSKFSFVYKTNGMLFWAIQYTISSFNHSFFHICFYRNVPQSSQ